jgi:23S rRNA (cytosine1962-C5)-methyltransferase
MQAKFEMFRNRLAKVDKHLSKLAKRQGLTCYRVYDHDLPEFPFCIDRYDTHLYVAEYKRRHGMDNELHAHWLQEANACMSEVLNVPLSAIHLKLRQRKPGRQGQYQKQEKEEASFFTVTEQQLKFWVNLDDYLDTGLFLDHRDTRKMVSAISAGKRVLNLFAYTGSFSVYAAAGGAKQVTTVDLSNTYIAWAKRNMELNGFSGDAYSFIAEDVLQWLPTISPSTFDVIVMDPPTFSNSKKMENLLDIQRDHVLLIQQAMRLLAPQGILFFSTNRSDFQLDNLALQSYQIQDITAATMPFDFQGKLKRYCFRIQA